MRTLTLATAALLLTTWPVTAYAGSVDPSAAARATTLCHGLEVTIAGTDRDDIMVGTEGPDVIRGYAGHDRIDALGGDDVVCGNLGRDVIVGGSGNDRLGGGHQGDHLFGGAGDDVLAGGRHRDFLVGGDGDDHLVMREQDDLDYSDSPAAIHADLGAGTIDGWGHDTVTGYSGVILTGTEGDDLLVGGDGIDHIHGLRGDDVIHGAGSTDYLHPGPGANLTDGGPGNDDIDLAADAAPDEAHGGPGSDLIGGRYHDFGGIGPHDRAYGGEGADTISVSTDLSSDQVVQGGTDAIDNLTLNLVKDTGRWHRVSFDLASGVLSADGQSQTFPGRWNLLVEDREEYQVVDAFDITGTEGPDELRVDGWTPVTMSGLGGDDLLTTGGGDDVIDGGDGTDSVYAGNGDDTCVSVEVVAYPGWGSGCEVGSP